MNDNRLIYLLNNIRQATATKEEIDELLDLIRNDRTGAIVEQIDFFHQSHSNVYNTDMADWEKTIEAVLHADRPVKPAGRVRKLGWLKYAAAAILILAVGGYFMSRTVSKKPEIVQHKPSKVDFPPGSDGAVLTLADGTEVILDSMGNGIVATQNGTEVVIRNGLLMYDPTGNPAGTVANNTMTTSKGKQFRLVLPDGTRVWLNAASSINYPTVFTGNERNVEIDGEVYFEVAKNAKMPFNVKVNEYTQVKVLGTYFNINAYKNEKSLKTTLIEGSVKVKAHDQFKMLKPGQQAIVVSSKLNVVNDANIDKVMAWKNGYFNFDSSTLADVMKQLERWYDINVEYESGVPDLRFGGEISRNLSLQDVLDVLKRAKVHFRLEEGRKLIVTK